jgi:predicted transglutaminase-like cysteine proteinase
MHITLRALVMIGALGVSACATSPQSLVPLPSTPMMSGIPVRDPPPGFLSFCLRFADQCTYDAAESDTIKLDPQIWALANSVNLTWNTEIWPEHDKSHYDRTEYWTIPTDGYGDCKDYALAKREQLAASGIPMQALRVAIVLTDQGERHAVLTIATDKGDYVLDNLTDQILPWTATSYHWIGRQDPHDPLSWVALDGTPVHLASLTSPADRDND